MTNEDMLARRIMTLGVGEYIKVFGQMKVIRYVWLVDSSGNVSSPTRMTFQQIRDYYAQTLSVMDTGTPAYWAPAYVRIDPNLTIDGTEFTIDSFDEFVIDSTTASNGIIFAPPTDTEYTIDVLGKFYSTDMSADEDTSIWTELYPNVLLYAALYQLEVTHRNTSGARDWLGAIDNELIAIDMDSVDFVSEHIDQMEG
jgi:hypothetical protein